MRADAYTLPLDPLIDCALLVLVLAMEWHRSRPYSPPRNGRWPGRLGSHPFPRTERTVLLCARGICADGRTHSWCCATNRWETLARPACLDVRSQTSDPENVSLPSQRRYALQGARLRATMGHG